MEGSTAVAKIEERPAQVAETSQQRFDVVARQAEAWARSTIIPAAYQGKPSNCLVAIEMSHRTGVPVLAVMQNLHVIQGKPSWSAQFLIAAANASGRFSPLRYRFHGEEGKDTWGCRVVATDLRNGEELVGSPVTMAMAAAEGWSTKAGSKWKTMPEQMLRYRAAAFWARAYAPELAVGLQTVEEVEDIAGAGQALRPQAIGAILDAGDVTIEHEDDGSPATPEQVKQLNSVREKARAADEIGMDEEDRLDKAVKAKDGPTVREAIRQLQIRLANRQPALAGMEEA